MRSKLLWVPLALALTGCGYNRIQELDERTEQMEANIEAELLRRNDLIPNLVTTVEQAAEFEQETFTEVARARAGLSAARERVAEAVRGDTEGQELARAADELSQQARLFINVAVEAYPQLRANQNFTALQDELAETENRLNVARRDYNESVAQYNTYIRRFPQTLTARVIGAERKEPFEAPAGAREAPRVQFEN